MGGVQQNGSELKAKGFASKFCLVLDLTAEKWVWFVMPKILMQKLGSLNYNWEYFPQQGLFAWGFGDTVVSEGLSIFWSWVVSFLVICRNRRSVALLEEGGWVFGCGCAGLCGLGSSARLQSSYCIDQTCIHQDFNKTEKLLKLPCAFQQEKDFSGGDTGEMCWELLGSWGNLIFPRIVLFSAEITEISKGSW